MDFPMLKILAVFREGVEDYTVFTLYNDGWHVYPTGGDLLTRVMFDSIFEAIKHYPNICAFFTDKDYLDTHRPWRQRCPDIRPFCLKEFELAIKEYQKLSC
jgi:hypothetical protein